MGNKVVIIVIALVVVIGAVLGLGVAGVVKIPGLSPPAKATKKEKADKLAEAKKQEAAKAEADKAAKQQAADAFAKLVADRDQLVKASKWPEALPLAQQAVDALSKGKAPAPQLDAATAVLTKVQAEVDKAAAPKPDLNKGYAKLAAVWAEIAPENITAILETDYKPDTAAPILKRMDEDKVAAVLSSMKPKEAAAYSEALAKESSKPPATPAAASSSSGT